MINALILARETTQTYVSTSTRDLMSGYKSGWYPSYLKIVKCRGLFCWLRERAHRVRAVRCSLTRRWDAFGSLLVEGHLYSELQKAPSHTFTCAAAKDKINFESSFNLSFGFFLILAYFLPDHSFSFIFFFSVCVFKKNFFLRYI